MTQASDWMGIKSWHHLVFCPLVSYHLLKIKMGKFPVSAHTVFGSWGEEWVKYVWGIMKACTKVNS